MLPAGGAQRAVIRAEQRLRYVRLAHRLGGGLSVNLNVAMHRSACGRSFSVLMEEERVVDRASACMMTPRSLRIISDTLLSELFRTYPSPA